MVASKVLVQCVALCPSIMNPDTVCRSVGGAQPADGGRAGGDRGASKLTAEVRKYDKFNGRSSIWWRRPASLRRFPEVQRADVRVLVGKEPAPNDGILDSQRAKKTDNGLIWVRRGKKVAGRKRHRLVDILGLIFSLAVLPAHAQDSDGAEVADPAGD